MPSPSRSPIDGSKMKPMKARMFAASKPSVVRVPAPIIKYELCSTKSLMPPTTSSLSLTGLEAGAPARR